MNASEILLTGDISRAFLDVQTIADKSCQVQANIFDAIDLAARKDFAVVAVVISSPYSKLNSALKALRKANRDAKIILLAQMRDEPAAIQMADSTCNGQNLADDYLICPVTTDRFFQFINPAANQPAAGFAKPLAFDFDMKLKIKKLEELAVTDELTSLKNRRYIWEFTSQIIELAKKENGRVTLLMFDIDNFKHYNDVYGHSAGDEILKEAAVLMRRSCRPHDIVGRIGGDEFTVIFWDDPKLKSADLQSERRSTSAEHPKEAIFIAKRFRRELNKAELSRLGPEGKGVLTISGGLASFPRDCQTTQQLFEQADRALLEAKRNGKNIIYLVGKNQNDIADIE